MTTTTRLEESYEQAHQKSQALLKQIESLLFDMPAPENAEYPPTWGHVGSLIEINHQLETVLEFMEN